MEQNRFDIIRQSVIVSLNRSFFWNIFFIKKNEIKAGSLAGCAVDFSLYPVDTIKTRLQQKKFLRNRHLFSSLYSGIGSVLLGSGPSSALFFTSYNLIKYQFPISTEWICHIFAATIGEIVCSFILFWI